MRFLNEVVVSAGDATGTVNSSTVDASQMINVSAQIISTDGANAGTLKMQVSNDHIASGNLPGQFTVTNWIDLSGATATVAAGGAKMITTQTLCYQWIRFVWTPSAGAGTITVTIKTVNY